MARQQRRTSILFVAVAATGFWSCGGSAEGPTSPVALLESPAAAVSGPVDGGVTASAKGKLTICHKGQSKQVPPSAVGGHLGHGDRLGACAPQPEVACPCFTATELANVAGQCSSSLNVSCPAQYSLSLFCAAGGGGGTVGNLGYFEARLGTGTCSTRTQDPMTGNEVTHTIPVTPTQFESCRQAIVGTSFSPASCPR